MQIMRSGFESIISAMQVIRVFKLRQGGSRLARPCYVSICEYSNISNNFFYIWACLMDKAFMLKTIVFSYFYISILFGNLIFFVYRTTSALLSVNIILNKINVNGFTNVFDIDAKWHDATEKGSQRAILMVHKFANFYVDI